MLFEGTLRSISLRYAQVIITSLFKKCIYGYFEAGNALFFLDLDLDV